MDKLKRSSAPATILALLLFCAPLVFAFGVPYYPTGFYGWFEPEEEYVQLIWDDNDPEDEVDYYCVQRADGLDGEFYTIDSQIADKSGDPYVYYEDWTVDPEEEDYYQYRAKAHNSSGWSGWSEHEIVAVYPEKK